ncbi:MAG: hypothetical protein E6Q96_09675 [Cyclobacteriaceae bacterium]|nr:MAG: hypothetical protein E6Q96_09675 [Cyclobacteriaceae bacterium]
MRYQELASKLMYYIGILIFVFGISFFTFLLYKATLLPDETLFFFLVPLTSIVGAVLVFFINKVIHVRLDVQRSVILFGTLLMSNEIPIEQVKLMKKYRFIGNRMVKLKIGQKSFYYLEQEADSESYFVK